jgi:hypothetical protein
MHLITMYEDLISTFLPARPPQTSPEVGCLRCGCPTQPGTLCSVTISRHFWICCAVSAVNPSFTWQVNVAYHAGRQDDQHFHWGLVRVGGPLRTKRGHLQFPSCAGSPIASSIPTVFTNAPCCPSFTHIDPAISHHLSAALRPAPTILHTRRRSPAAHLQP